MAFGDIHLRFAWQAWHLWHWAGSGGTLGPILVPGDAAVFCVAGVALGSFHVAGVALGDIYLRFAWQAWHVRHWAGSGGALGTVLVAADAAGLCAVGDIHLRFMWLAWHLATTTFVLRGRRGTYGTGLALVARLDPFWSPVTPRYFA